MIGRKVDVGEPVIAITQPDIRQRIIGINLYGSIKTVNTGIQPIDRVLGPIAEAP